MVHLILFVALFVSQLTNISDDAAIAKAETIWGSSAAVVKARVGETEWFYQVGCFTNDKVTIAGRGDTWEAAFANVDRNANGPHTLTAVVRDIAGNTTESAPVTVYACNSHD